MNQKFYHLCEVCGRQRPLTYHRGRDEYICDGCWDELPVQSTDDKSEDEDEIKLADGEEDEECWSD